MISSLVHYRHRSHTAKHYKQNFTKYVLKALNHFISFSISDYLSSPVYIRRTTIGAFFPKAMALAPPLAVAAAISNVAN